MPDEPIVDPVRPPIPSQPLPQEPLAGTSVGTAGVTGQSNESFGVMGQSVGPAGSIGPPVAVSDGVYGVGMNGVHGVAHTGQTNPQGLGNSGVLGENVNTGAGGNGGNGVSGVSSDGNGVYGQTGADGVSDPQNVVTIQRRPRRPSEQWAWRHRVCDRNRSRSTCCECRKLRARRRRSHGCRGGPLHRKHTRQWQHHDTRCDTYGR